MPGSRNGGPKTESNGGGGNTGCRRLLIVEPEPLLRWSLAKYLSKWFEVFPVDSVAPADRVLDQQPIDAVVVSDQLPDRRAQSIENHARSRNAATCVIHTVTTRVVGSAKCIEKPFELARLATLLGVNDCEVRNR